MCGSVLVLAAYAGCCVAFGFWLHWWEMNNMNKDTGPFYELLELEERFLRDCGWERVATGWREPDACAAEDRLPRVLSHDHAVNSEKAFGVERGTCTSERKAALRGAEEKYLLASGWVLSEREELVEETGRDPHAWVAPTGRRRRRASHRVAVNSQKAHDRFSYPLW
jgi:hypothetical protein